LNLQNGPNTIHLTATNACGNAIKDTIINFGSCIPAVNFNMNVENGSSTTNPTFDFTATVENYSETTAVIVKINGNTASGYNNTNGLISGTINLPFGATTIEITAANSCGTDTKTFTINRCNLITFGLVQPATNNTTVTFPNQLIQFNVFNSDNQTAITISQNGNGLQGFTRTGSLVQGTAVLVNGTNQFQVNILSVDDLSQLPSASLNVEKKGDKVLNTQIGKCSSGYASIQDVNIYHDYTGDLIKMLDAAKSSFELDKLSKNEKIASYNKLVLHTTGAIDFHNKKLIKCFSNVAMVNDINKKAKTISDKLQELNSLLK
jgi:hypothetical protein